MAGFIVDQGKEQAALMGGVLQWAAPVDGETLGCPQVDVWSEVACLLECRAPSQDWEVVEATPRQVGKALGIISRFLEKQRASEVVGKAGSFFPYNIEKGCKGERCPPAGSARRGSRRT